jgi:hypothetical protein
MAGGTGPGGAAERPVLPQTVTYARGFADPLIGLRRKYGSPRSSGVRGWRRPGRGTARRWPSCRLTRCSCPEATRIPTVFEPDGAEP